MPLCNFHLLNSYDCKVATGLFFFLSIKNTKVLGLDLLLKVKNIYTHRFVK